MAELDQFSQQAWEAIQTTGETSFEDAEVEFAYATVPATKLLQAQVIAPPSVTELPKFNSLDRERASAFLKQELSWGETGQELMDFLHQRKIDTPFIVIYHHCESMLRDSEKANPNFSPRDLHSALDQATAVGLLITGMSQGYRDYGHAPEESQRVYVFNRNPEAIEILVSEENPAQGDLSALDVAAGSALLNQTPFFRDPRITFSPTLSAREFFQFLSEARTMTEILRNPEFYPDRKESFSPRIREFVEGLLNHAEQIGLVKTAQIEGAAPKFKLSGPGKELLKA